MDFARLGRQVRARRSRDAAACCRRYPEPESRSAVPRGGPDHSVHKVLAQSSTQLSPGYIHLDHSPSLDIRDEITLAAWVYMLDEGGTIVGKWFQLGSWSYVLHGVGSGFRLRWQDDTQTNLTNFAVPYLQWAHYAATYDGSQMRVFVNGELVASQDVDGKRIKSTSNPVWIGDSGYLGGSPILLDDVQIWNVARSQEQIRESMHNGLSGDEPGLVGWFPMDLQPLIDRSPHANNGRLEGAAAIHTIGIPSDERHAPEQVLWLLPSNLPTAMEMGDADRVRQLTKEGRWHIIEGDSADLFDGTTLKGWWGAIRPVGGSGWTDHMPYLRANTFRDRGNRHRRAISTPLRGIRLGAVTRRWQDGGVRGCRRLQHASRPRRRRAAYDTDRQRTQILR